MDESLSEWLRLRATADWAARSDTLARRVIDAIGPVDRVHVLDLCTGTGSNLRYLIERLPSRQRWMVVDRDPALLREVPERLSLWAQERGLGIHIDSDGCHVRGDRLECDVETRQMNLDTLDAAIFEGQHLVTASALLDLAAESWLDTLATRCRSVGASALFALTYTGGSSCEPSDPADALVRGLFNRHQKTDKGLGGPAAGPDAWAAAERSFVEAGYVVESAPSDWTLRPDERAFQRRLIEGWAEAATEIAPGHATTIDEWRHRRLEHVDAGRSRIAVCHYDMAAWLGRWVAR